MECYEHLQRLIFALMINDECRSIRIRVNSQQIDKCYNWAHLGPWLKKLDPIFAIYSKKFKSRKSKCNCK